MIAYTVTVTGVRYDAFADVERSTPLEDYVERVELDNIVVTFSVGRVTGAEWALRPEAVANRMVGYTLDSPLAALESLVREAVFSWAPSVTPADPANTVDVNGGVDDRIAVGWKDDGAKAAAESLLATFAERITAAREMFSPAPPEAPPAVTAVP
jgi:hypothetical protein